MINRRQAFYYSINFKIISLLTVLTIVPLVINVFIWHSLTLEAAETEAIENTYHILGVSNDIFETALRDTYGIVSMIAVDHTGHVTSMLDDNFETDVDRYLNTRELETYITSISGGARTYYSGISIIDAKGETVNFGVAPPYEAEYLKQYEDQLLSPETTRLITAPHHFKDAEHQGTFRYSDMVLSVVRPVFYAGEYKGLISGNVWCNILLDIFDNAVEDETEIIIFDRQINEIVFSTDHQQKDTFNNNEFVQKSLGNTRSTNGDFYMDINNEDYLCVYQNSEFTNWTTLALIPRNQLLEGYNSTSKKAFFVTILFSILSLITGVILAAMITKNLRKLNFAMQSVDEKNLDITVEINSRDEIGYLFQQYTHMLDRIKRLINNVKEEEATKRKYEIQALQSQINPHFLYNTLNSIKFLASMQGVENIQSVSEALSEILHTYMNNATVFLPIEKELDLLNKYSLIQSYRFTNTYTLNIQVAPELSDCLLPKLLLQPLVENCIVHGFRNQTGSGSIWLTIEKFSETDLRISVIDNGAGFDEKAVTDLLNQPPSDDHIGIFNVHRRVKMYFGEKYGLRAYMNQQGYSVFELTMPMITGKDTHTYV